MDTKTEPRYAILDDIKLITEEQKWIGARNTESLYLTESEFFADVPVVKVDPTVNQLRIRETIQRHTKIIILLYLLREISMARYLMLDAGYSMLNTGVAGFSLRYPASRIKYPVI